MVNDGDYVAVFNSIHRVMKGEKILKGAGFKVLLIPAPRSISSDCGLALRYGADERAAVESCLEESGLPPEELYLKDGAEYRKIER